jgi:hypothetical protein
MYGIYHVLYLLVLFISIHVCVSLLDEEVGELYSSFRLTKISCVMLSTTYSYSMVTEINSVKCLKIAQTILL